MQLRLLSVNVGMPRVIGMWHGEAVLSGIAKAPLDQPAVFVGRTNIEGDGQADLSVHGGADKAVYAYPSEHWEFWSREANPSCVPATFGENLTLEGADENAVAIGDRFGWGEAVLEVSQPRAPCFKLGLHTARPDLPQRLTRSARSGWYLRVVREGRAPVAGGTLERIFKSGGSSVRDAFLAQFDPRATMELRHRVLVEPALAEPWRQAMGRRIAAKDANRL